LNWSVGGLLIGVGLLVQVDPPQKRSFFFGFKPPGGKGWCGDAGRLQKGLRWIFGSRSPGLKIRAQHLDLHAPPCDSSETKTKPSFGKGLWAALRPSSGQNPPPGRAGLPLPLDSRRDCTLGPISAPMHSSSVAGRMWGGRHGAGEPACVRAGHGWPCHAHGMWLFEANVFYATSCEANIAYSAQRRPQPSWQ